MSLQNLDKIDERAKKFLIRGYVGPTAAKNDTGYTWHFATDDKRLVQTTTFLMGVVRCSYCGQRAYPIQKNIPDCYDVTGHTCVCKGAMDEVEHQQTIKALKKKHEEELYELEKQAPKIDLVVKHKAFQQLTRKAEEYAQAGDWWRYECIMRDIKQGLKD